MRTIRAFGQQRSCSTAQLANYAARLVNSAVDQMRCAFGQLRSYSARLRSYSARLVNCCAVGQLPRVWTTLSSAQRDWPNAQIGQTRLTESRVHIECGPVRPCGTVPFAVTGDA